MAMNTMEIQANASWILSNHAGQNISVNSNLHGIYHLYSKEQGGWDERIYTFVLDLCRLIRMDIWLGDNERPLPYVPHGKRMKTDSREVRTWSLVRPNWYAWRPSCGRSLRCLHVNHVKNTRSERVCLQARVPPKVPSHARICQRKLESIFSVTSLNFISNHRDKKKNPVNVKGREKDNGWKKKEKLELSQGKLMRFVRSIHHYFSHAFSYEWSFWI